ncbi:hypothetical protein BDZ45DRAFT_755567 [Acephala macrosclerotiorum]|nr:hypothetical protein BDZ45DRAFT_755567 [Acephala macrosclerotiorum]
MGSASSPSGHDAPKECEEILIEALRILSPNDILRSKELVTSFKEFLGRGTAGDCLQLLPPSHQTALSNTKPRSSAQPNPKVALSNSDTCIAKYFEEKGLSPSRTQLLVRLVESLAKAPQLHPNSYEHLWRGKNTIFDDPGHGLHPLNRLRRGRLKIEKAGTEYGCAARLCLVFSVNHVNHYSISASKSELDLGRGRDRKTAAFDIISQKYNIPKKDLKLDQEKSRNYIHMIITTGPGSILEIDPKTLSYWEVKASTKDIDLVHEYKKTHLPMLHDRSIALNPVAALTFVNGLREYGWTTDEVLSCKTPLLIAVRKHLDGNLMISRSENPDNGDQSSRKRGSDDIYVDGTEPNPEEARSSFAFQEAEACLPRGSISIEDERSESCNSVSTGSNSSNEVISHELEHPDDGITASIATGHIESHGVGVGVGGVGVDGGPLMADDLGNSIELQIRYSNPDNPKSRGQTGGLSTSFAPDSTRQNSTRQAQVVIDPEVTNHWAIPSYLPDDFGQDPARHTSVPQTQQATVDPRMMAYLNTSSYLPDDFDQDPARHTSVSQTQQATVDPRMIAYLNMSSYLPDDFDQDPARHTLIPQTQQATVDPRMMAYLNMSSYLPDDFGQDPARHTSIPQTQQATVDPKMMDFLASADHLLTDLGEISYGQ